MVEAYGSLGFKIVRHFYPKLDLFYFNDNYDYPEVIKGEFDQKADPIFVTKNFKGQLKLSGSSQYGEVIWSNDDIRRLTDEFIFAPERPKLNRFIALLNDKLSSQN